MKTRTSRKPGFTLVEIMIVVGIVGLLAALAVPNFLRARTKAQRSACIENMRQIEAGKQQWAMENKKTETDTPTSDDVKRYAKSEQWPNCPSGGTYTIGAMNTVPTCSMSAEPELHALPVP